MARTMICRGAPSSNGAPGEIRTRGLLISCWRLRYKSVALTGCATGALPPPDKFPLKELPTFPTALRSVGSVYPHCEPSALSEASNIDCSSRIVLYYDYPHPSSEDKQEKREN